MLVLCGRLLSCCSLCFFYLDGRLNWTRCKEHLYIKGCDGFRWFQPFALEQLNEVLGVLEVMWGLAYKGIDDAWESYLATPYVMDPLLETMNLRGVPALWILGRP